MTDKTSKKNTVKSSTREPLWDLRLYVAGRTPKSVAAFTNLQKLCEEHLAGRYDLEIVDVYQQPVLAKDEQILAAPTLIKKLPLPLRRIIGDMSNKDRVLLGLDLRPRERDNGLSLVAWTWDTVA